MKEKMKISVVGAGRWGTLLAWYLDHLGYQVTLYDIDQKKIEKLKIERKNKYGVIISPKIELTTDFNLALEKCEIIIVAIISQGVRQLCQELANFNLKDKIIISAMKGMERKTGKRMSEIFQENLGEIKLAVLAGPGHVENIGRFKKTSLVLASSDENVRNKMTELLSSEFISIQPTSDLVGVELGGAFKNVVGVAAGICDGLDEEDLKAVIIDRSLAEITQLGEKLGAQKETFLGLSFLGDLLVTCFGKHSKNRRFGEIIAKGKKIDDLPPEELPEGFHTIQSVYELARRLGINMPICQTAHQIIYQNVSPKKALDDLWSKMTSCSLP